MIDHVILNVRDLTAARRFYDAVLPPLGYEPTVEFESGVAYGWEGKPDFWLAARPEPSTSVHVAFRAPDRGAVDAFHRLGLETGATDNGAPGPRPHYHEHYYGAFLLDPDGNNVEAVCHARP